MASFAPSSLGNFFSILTGSLFALFLQKKKRGRGVIFLKKKNSGAASVGSIIRFYQLQVNNVN